jgi:hypothetical protein
VAGRLFDKGGRLSDTGGRLSDTGGRLSDTGGRLSDTGGRLSDTGGRLSDTGGRSCKGGWPALFFIGIALWVAKAGYVKRVASNFRQVAGYVKAVGPFGQSGRVCAEGRFYILGQSV